MDAPPGSPTSGAFLASISMSLAADQPKSTADEMIIEPGAPARGEEQDLVDQKTAVEDSFHAPGEANASCAAIEASSSNRMEVEPSSAPSLTAEGGTAKAGTSSPEPNARAGTARSGSSSSSASAAAGASEQPASSIVAAESSASQNSQTTVTTSPPARENDSKTTSEKNTDGGDGVVVVHTIEQLSTKAEDQFKKELAKYNRARDLPQSRYRGVSWDRRMNYWRVKLNAVHIGFFKDEADGARAYDKAKLAIITKDTRILELNFPEEVDLNSIPSTVILKKAMMKSELAALEGSDSGAATGAGAAGGPKPLNPGRPSIYRGVMWDSGTRCWRAKIKVRARTWYLGVFREEPEAARAYDAAALFLMRDRSTLNFPNEDYTNVPLARVPPDFVEEFVREMQQLRDAGTLYKKIANAHNALMGNDSNRQADATMTSSSGGATLVGVTTTTTPSSSSASLAATTTTITAAAPNVRITGDERFVVRNSIAAGGEGAAAETYSEELNVTANLEGMKSQLMKDQPARSSAVESDVVVAVSNASGSVPIPSLSDTEANNGDILQPSTESVACRSSSILTQRVIGHSSSANATTTTTGVTRPEPQLMTSIPSPPSGRKPSRTTTESSSCTTATHPSMYSPAKEAGDGGPVSFFAIPPPPPPQTFIANQHQPALPRSLDFTRDPKSLGMYGRATLSSSPSVFDQQHVREDNTDEFASSSAIQADVPTTGPVAGGMMDKKTRARELEFRHFRSPLKMIGVKQLGNTGLFRATLDYHSHELFLGDYEFAVDACHAHDLIAVRLFGQFHCRENNVVNCRPSYIPILARNEFLIPAGLFRLAAQMVKLCPSVANEVETNANKLMTKRTEMKQALKSVRETYKRRAYDLNHLPKAALTTAKTVLVDQNNESDGNQSDDDENNNNQIALDEDEDDADEQKQKQQQQQNSQQPKKLKQSSNNEKEDEKYSNEMILGGRSQSLKDQIERIEGEIRQKFDAKSKEEISSSKKKIKPRNELLLSFSTSTNNNNSNVKLQQSTTTSTDAASVASSPYSSSTNTENVASMTLAELAKRAVVMASMRKRVKLSG